MASMTLSAVFLPGEAVWEDPVTGSAHTMLIPFWSARLGKSKMLARQISPRGDIRCELKGDRVLMAGQAVTGCRRIATLNLSRPPLAVSGMPA